MSESIAATGPITTTQRIFAGAACAAVTCLVLLTATGSDCLAQTAAAPAPAAVEKPLPGLDLSSMDLSADPCVDMYKFACGKFSANHPIPSDQPDVDPFYVLYNVNTQELNTILQKAEAGGAARSPDEQKIGDFFKACMDTTSIDAEGLKSLKPMLDRIDALGNSPGDRAKLAAHAGHAGHQSCHPVCRDFRRQLRLDLPCLGHQLCGGIQRHRPVDELAATER